MIGARRNIVKPSGGGGDLPPGSPHLAYDMTDLSKMWQDNEGTIPVVNVDDRIGLVESLTLTNNGDAIQPTNSQRPYLGAGAIGVRGNGNIENLKTLVHDPAAATSQYTTLGVRVKISDTTTPDPIQMVLSMDNAAIMSAIYTKQANTSIYAGASSSGVSISAPVTPGNVYTVVAVFNDANSILRIDGSVAATGSATTAVGANTAMSMLGISRNGSNAGTVYRAALYYGTLTGSDLTNLETWLEGTA